MFVIAIRGSYYKRGKKFVLFYTKYNGFSEVRNMITSSSYLMFNTKEEAKTYIKTNRHWLSYRLIEAHNDLVLGDFYVKELKQ